MQQLNIQLQNFSHFSVYFRWGDTYRLQQKTTQWSRLTALTLSVSPLTVWNRSKFFEAITPLQLCWLNNCDIPSLWSKCFNLTKLPSTKKRSDVPRSLQGSMFEWQQEECTHSPAWDVRHTGLLAAHQGLLGPILGLLRRLISAEIIP